MIQIPFREYQSADFRGAAYSFVVHRQPCPCSRGSGPQPARASDEHARILDSLAAYEVPREQVKLVGRMVVWNDVYLDGEELIVAPENLLEKGRVLTVKLPGTGGTPGPTPQAPIAPDFFARMNGSSFQFWRPYFHDNTGSIPNAIVVPNNPTFLLGVMNAALTDISNADDDCLVSNRGNLFAMNRTSWDAMGIGQATTPRSFVVYGPLSSVCPGLIETTIAGCALAPRFGSIKLNGGTFASRMMIGPRLGFVDTKVTGDNANARRTVRHEVLHALGLAHPDLNIENDCTPAELANAGCTDEAACCNPTSPQGGVVPSCCALGAHVPGTNVSPTVTSIMTGNCPDGVGTGCSNTLTSEDVDMIDTLYSPPTGGSCAYVHNYTTIVGD